jgi:PAS domain S-box-containing protein
MTTKDPGRMSTDELLRELVRLGAGARRAIRKTDKPDREQLIRQLRIDRVELEIRNRELHDAQELLREAATSYSDLFDSVPVGYCRLEPGGRIREINLTASALLGVPREQLVGRMFATVAGLREKAPFLAHLRRCAVAKERVTTEIVLRARAGRRPREIRLVSDPIRDAKGDGAACRTALVDITDLKAMERRIRLLADAGALLAESLSTSAVLETAQRVLVPALADICLIDLASESGTIERAAITFADLSKQSSLHDRLLRTTPRAGWSSPHAQVIASGAPMLLAEMPDQVRGRAEADDNANMLWRAGVRSLMVVPLAAHGRSFGAVTLAAAESGRLYSRADLRLAQELAGRVAVALDNARLYDETQRMNLLLLGGAKASGIVAISPDAIISVDENYHITLWNDGAEKIYGYSREEATGASLDMLIPQRHRAAHRVFVERFANGRELARKVGGPHGDLVGLRKNGEEFPADSTISKLELGGEKVLTVAVRDITDQKRIESEQRTLGRLGQVVASRLDFEDTLTQVVRLVAEEVGDFVVLYLTARDQPARRVRSANRDPSTEWYNELVLTMPDDARPDHPVSRAIAAKQPLLVDVTPAVLQSLAHSEEHGRALAMLRLRSIMVVPLITGESCLGALLFKSASRAYGARDLQLAEEIGRRTALLIDNARLHKTAQYAISARDNILRVVAHDLRNPLGAIALEAATLSMDDAPAGTVHDAAAVIQQCVNVMKRMIQDLLDADRIESGRLSVTRTGVPVAAAITEFVRQQKASAALASIELRVDVARDVGSVLADPDRLFQVLENLVSNAERFTPNGGRITIGARRRAKDVQFWVSDTGAGMDPVALAHVFDRFSAERRIERGGTGLGLPIVKGIVEGHGGQVWAESKVGAGSAFFFTMPIAPDDTPPRQARHSRRRKVESTKGEPSSYVADGLQRP